jgi:hypothetical protein
LGHDAVAYVQFALEHPAIFRTMFSDHCDGDSSERVAASAAIAEYVGALVRRAVPGADLDARVRSMPVRITLQLLAIGRLPR